MLKIYKTFISPIFLYLFGHSCRFTPTCSEYMDEAIKKHGIFKGGAMSIVRIVRCNPYSTARYYPVA
jgi:uncharacterized protein